MIQLLTYSEFKTRADFTDNVSSDRFNKFEKICEETYLRDLIGSELVTKLKTELYADLLPYVKDCLAHKCELYFIETGNVLTTGQGAVVRDSQFSKPPEWLDKQAKINAVLDVLRSYETVLRSTIEAGDYTGYNDDLAISKKTVFTITSIGD